MKKKLFYFVIGWMVLLLGACGKKSEDTASVSKEYVYRAQELALNGMENVDSMSLLKLMDDRIYTMNYSWLETGISLTLVSQNTDGSDVKKIGLETGENTAYSWLTPVEDGSYYAVCEEYFEDASDPENYIWRNDFYLVKLDAEGKEVFRQHLNGEDGENYWLQWMQVMPDGQMVVSDIRGIAIYDANGTKVKDVATLDEMESSSALVLADGKLLLNVYQPKINRTVMIKLDAKTGEMSEEYILPGGSDNYTLYPGKGYDLLLVGNSGVFAYNLGDTEIIKMMDYVDSDINTSYIYNLAAVSETQFYGLMEDEAGETQLFKFTKVPPEEVADKKVLTLACNGLDWDIRKRVVEYNKTNEQYRIRIEDYSEYNTNEDYSAGTTRLNTDIASGNVPDLLILDSQMPVESYMAKGLFEDLYPYIDSDQEIAKEELFPNVLAAYENNGKLYRIVPKFVIQTVMGKTSKVGATPGWTLGELKQLMESEPEEMESFTEKTRDEMLRYSIEMTGEQFINWETGECRFNSDEFIQLLEFVGEFPEALEDDYYNDSYWMSYDTLWREDKVLLSSVYLDGFDSYHYMKKVVFGEDITLIGFPMEEGNGSVIMGQLEMVMSAKSKNKDGAWEFIRYFLTEEYQSQINYGWPLSMKQAEVLAQKAQKKPSYEDENGNVIEYEPTFMIGDVELPLGQMTQEETEEVLAFVKSVNQIYVYNENLIQIVEEEAASYFSGQKNAKEVTDIIQSRVQIYVNENR